MLRASRHKGMTVSGYCWSDSGGICGSANGGKADKAAGKKWERTEACGSIRVNTRDCLQSAHKKCKPCVDTFSAGGGGDLPRFTLLTMKA